VQNGEGLADYWGHSDKTKSGIVFSHSSNVFEGMV